jgi:glutathione S-transferase
MVDQWTDWNATTFQPAWIDVFWRFYRTPEAQRDQPAIDRAMVATEHCFDLLDSQLAQTRFVAGDELTYADIPAGTAMFRWTTMDITRKPHPNLERWHADLHGRPPYREAVEVDYSELAGRTAA